MGGCFFFFFSGGGERCSGGKWVAGAVYIEADDLMAHSNADDGRKARFLGGTVEAGLVEKKNG